MYDRDDEKWNGGIHRNVGGKGTPTDDHAVTKTSSVQSVR